MCTIERERERDRERGGEKERERKKSAEKNFIVTVSISSINNGNQTDSEYIPEV